MFMCIHVRIQYAIFFRIDAFFVQSNFWIYNWNELEKNYVEKIYNFF